MTHNLTFCFRYWEFRRFGVWEDFQLELRVGVGEGLELELKTRTFWTRSNDPWRKVPPDTQKLRNLTNHTTTHLNFNSFQEPFPEFPLRIFSVSTLIIKHPCFNAQKWNNRLIDTTSHLRFFINYGTSHE